MLAQMQAAEDGVDLSDLTVQMLESQLALMPDDLILRSQLLGYYLLQRENTARHTRRQHILWLVRHAPAAWITGSVYALIGPNEDDAALDEARQLWDQQVQAHLQNAQVLGSAARFYVFQDAAMAEHLYRQAQALEPTNPQWAEALGQLLYQCLPDQPDAVRRSTAQQALTHFEIWDKYTEEEEKSGDFSALSKMAMAAVEARAFGTARTCADRLLAIALHDPTAGNSVHHGNLVLGRLAFYEGDTPTACSYLLASGRTPGSPQLDSFGPNMTLAKELLEHGERQAVLEYFGLCSTFWNGPDLNEWTAQVSNSEIPEFGPHLLY